MKKRSRDVSCLLAGAFAPRLAWASDPSGLYPFYMLFVLLVAGFATMIEWPLISAVMERVARSRAADGDVDDETAAAGAKSSEGCGFGLGLWAVNCVLTHAALNALFG